MRLVPAADAQATIELLRQAEPYSVDGAPIGDIVGGCELLDVMELGERVGAVAVEIDATEATIKAAVCHGSTYTALGELELLLRHRGVRSVGMFTRRLALVHNLTACGYRVKSFELEKDL